MSCYDGGTGTLRLPEFRKLVIELRSGNGPPAETITDAFKRFDEEMSGDIDVGELGEALRLLGINADGNAARSVISRYDGRRTLSLEEFRKVVMELRRLQGQ